MTPRFRLALAALVVLAACGDKTPPHAAPVPETPPPEVVTVTETKTETKNVFPAPEITGLTPSRGPSDGGTLAVLRGAELQDGVKVLFGTAEAKVKRLDAQTALVTTPAGSGPVDVTVENPDGQKVVFTKGFTYWVRDTTSAPAPKLTAVAPNTGPADGGTYAVLTGENLQDGVLAFFGASAATELTFAGSTLLTLRTPAGAPGSTDVALTNPDGQTVILAGGFAYSKDAGDAPTVAGVTPMAGSAAGKVDVTVVGSGFKAGAFVLFGGRPAEAVVPQGSATLKVQTPSSPLGTVDVVVTNPDGRSGVLRRGFSFYTSGPALLGVEPAVGNPAGGTAVTVRGRGFDPKVTVTFGGKPLGFVKWIDERTLSGTTGPGSAGAVDVEAVNPDGQADTLQGGFTYGVDTTPQPLALLKSVPDNGSIAGGTRVTLIGTGFDATAKVKFGTADATQVRFISAGSLTAVSPSGVVGPVEISVTQGTRTSKLANGFWYFDATTTGNGPSVARVAPGSGPTSGGTLALVSGSNFKTGARVFFGATEARSVRVISGTSLTAVAPSGAAGAVDLRVENPDGQIATLAQGFAFLDPAALGPAPTLSALTPATGSTLDPTNVSLTTQNVDAGALVFVGGAPASAVTVKSATSVDATFAPAPAGPVDVVITNPDGQSGTLAQGFSFAIAAPTLSSVSPNTVPLAGGVTVLVAGRGFNPGATVSIDGAAQPTNFVDGTALTFSAPSHLAGTVDVQVSNPDNQKATLTAALTWANVVLGPAPTVASIAPSSGPSTGGTLSLLTGTNFAPGAKVLFGKTAATRVTVLDATRLSAQAPAGSVGATDVSVVNPDGQSAALVRGFTYVDPASLGPAPTLASVTPSQGPEAGGTQIILTGAKFANGMLAFFGGYPAASPNVQSSGIATTYSPNGPKGAVDVAITTPDGQSSILGGAFKYVEKPSPQNIAPATGPTAGGTGFTLAGTGFASGAKVYFGTALATNVTVASATVITGTAPSNPGGKVSIGVQNPDGQSGTLADAFTYLAPPTADEARPGVGPSAGGTTVSILGTGFTPGATVKFGSTAASSVKVIDATRILAVTPAVAPGRVDVTVQNADGQAATITGGFVFDVADYLAARQASWPDQFVPAVRDDAQYTTDLGLMNLSGKAVTVTLTGTDGAGTKLASRALTSTIPAFGRVVVPNVLQFVKTAAASTNVTGTVGIAADGPVVPYTLLSDKVSGDAAVVLGGQASRGASRLLVPYASSVGVFKTWLAVANLGSTAASVDVTARDARGTALGKLTGLSIPAGGQYTTDDVLGAMNASNATATLDITASSTAAKLVATARTYSSSRKGGLVPARAVSEAATLATLAYVPDTSGETSSLFIANSDTANSAQATVSLRAGDGKVVGSQTLTIPAAGYAQVSDLARALLNKSGPTETISSVEITSTKPVVAAAQLVNTVSSDLRFALARPGGATRLAIPAADARTGLAVVNTGLARADVEIALRLDSGTARGQPLRVQLAPRGQFNAPAVLSALGAAGASGVLEIRSFNGQPLVAVARVGNDAAAAQGDALDAGGVLTLPTVDAIHPTTGPASGGTVAQVDGAFFLPGAQVLFGDAAATRSFVARDSAVVTVSPAGTAGASVDVSVINFDGSMGQLKNAFGYIDPSTLGAPPALASVTPQQVSTLGRTAISLAGSNFQAGPLVFVGMSPATGVAQVNPQRVDGAAPAGAVGPADVTLTNPDGQSTTLAGAVSYVVPPPSILSITPNSGPGTGGTVVHIKGDAFQAGLTVSVGGVPATLVNVLSATDLDATVPAGSDGPVSVTVSNPDGQTVTQNNGYTYVAAPVVASVAPTSGPTAGGTAIQISGKYFRSPAVVTVGSSAATNVQVQGGGQVITCNVPAGTPGPAAITVTNPDSQTGTLNNAYTYLAPIPPPSVSAVSPNYGPTTGGSSITVQGAGFQAGASVAFGSIVATQVTVLSPSAISVVTPGAAGPGPVDITVTNPDNQSGKLTNGFSYFQQADLPAIAVASVSPNEGSPSGGITVFVSGQGFKAGATVKFGTAASPTVNYLGPSALQAVVPAGTPGVVSVTVTNTDGKFATLANGFNYALGVTFDPPPMRLPMRVEPGQFVNLMFDADKDGDLDIFQGRRQYNCADDGGDQLLLNDGTGTFNVAATSVFPPEGQRTTQAAVVADFDGNGYPDVFAIPDFSNTCCSVFASFWKNNGGSFTRTDVSNLSTNMEQRALAVGDLNNDGKPDVYVATNGQDYWYKNNGNGTFTATTTGLPSVSDDSRGVCIADFDKDGDSDVFVVNGSNQQANYYLQGPAGTFTLSNSLLPIVGGGTGCVAAELRPGSGVTDLVVVKDGSIYQYLTNNGFGRFTDESASANIRRLPNPPASMRIGFPQPTASGGLVGGITAVDINSDGYVDLVMNHYDMNPAIQLYLNDGTGFFNLGTQSRVPNTLDAATYWSIGDVDSDGKPDLYISSDPNAQSRILLNRGGGKLEYATMKSLPELSMCVTDASAGDLDGDGDVDLVMTNGCKFADVNYNQSETNACRPSQPVHIWLNDGAGGYSDVTSTRFPAQAYFDNKGTQRDLTSNGLTTALVDVDKDGDLDLWVGTSGHMNDPNGTINPVSTWGLRLYINDGKGVFSEVSYPRIPYDTSPVVSIVPIDVNKDGWTDLWVNIDNPGSSCSARFKLLLNNAGFFFDVSGQLPYTNLPNPCSYYLRAATTADFNGDGYPDVYVATSQQNRMYYNQGAAKPGYFTEVTGTNVPNISDDSRGVVAGDLNGDKVPELFVVNSGVDRVNINNGAGFLSDVTATNWPSESVPYPYPNVCSGNYSPVNGFSTDLADIDGDGDLDVVVAGGNNGNLNHQKRLYVNNGNGSFTDRTVRLPYDQDAAQKILFLKANADAYPDIFVGTCGQPRVYLNHP